MTPSVNAGAAHPIYSAGYLKTAILVCLGRLDIDLIVAKSDCTF
jgi:hypothetical protein